MEQNRVPRLRRGTKRKKTETAEPKRIFCFPSSTGQRTALLEKT